MIVLITGMWWWAHKSDIPSGGPPTAQQNPVPEGRTLVGSLVRSGGQLQEVVVPSDANGLRLEARVEADFPSFDAILKTAEGRPMQTASNLKAEAEGSSKRVAVTLPSSQVAPGDYILTVRGLPAGRAPETVAEYAFRVRKD